MNEADRAEDGPNALEIARSVLRALAVPQVATLRGRLMPEMTVLSFEQANNEDVYVGGIADALAVDAAGKIDVVIDWKSDVAPSPKQIELYRDQVGDYLDSTDAVEALIVFATSGTVIRVARSQKAGADL